MEGIAIGPHRPDDWRFVREMLDLGVRETYPDLGTLGRVTARERLDAIFERHWSEPAKLVVIARERTGDRPVGVAWLEPSHHAVTELPEFMFLLLAVVESHQARGIGRALMRSGLDQAQARGASRIRLFVSADNDHARRLYARLGFRESTVEMRWDGPG